MGGGTAGAKKPRHAGSLRARRVTGPHAPRVMHGHPARLKSWMSAHNAAIMAVITLVIGVKLLGDGISGL